MTTGEMLSPGMGPVRVAQVGCGPSALAVLCRREAGAFPLPGPRFSRRGCPKGYYVGQRTKQQAPGRTSVSQPTGSTCALRHAPALPSCVTPGLSLAVWDLVCPVQRFHLRSLSSASLSPRLSLIISSYLLPASSRAVCFFLALSDSAGPRSPSLGPCCRSSPRPPPSGLPLSLAASGLPCHRPVPGPILPHFLAVPREKASGGDGLGASPPPSRRRRRPGLGGGPAPGASASPAPGPGLPGARRDGLHGELGVLRGAGARAPRQPPAPGESPGPSTGPVLGARGFGPRREQAAPASGRALRGWVWGEGCGKAEFT